MKKLLKYTIVLIGLLVIALIVTPFLFKDKIKNSVTNIINNNFDAKIDFENINFSLIKNFPHASISITNLSVINKAPFEGDTLVYAGTITAKTSLKELFKSSDNPIYIEEFSIKNALSNIIFNEKGVSNLSITTKNNENNNRSKETNKEGNLALSIQKYELENVRITYLDESTKTKLTLDKINHKGQGDFTNKFLDLNTYTSAIASLDFNGINYMNSANLLLDAVINLDFENNKFSFKENIAHINDFPLKFDGFMQLNKLGQRYDITFSTPSSSFDSALKLIPSAYIASTKDVKTSGEFSLNGWIRGIYSNNKIPLFNIEILSNNASIKYPELPKYIQNISIDAKIINQTGEIKDTYLNVSKFSFKIDDDVFSTKAKISDITKNILVNANIEGSVNLANISSAYPINLEQKLSGTIKANTEIKLDINSIKHKKYENIKVKGLLNLTDFIYKSEEFFEPFVISYMDLKFNPSYIQMSKLDAKIGNSHFQINGNIDDLYGFLFKKQTLKGKFNLKSDNIKISDLVTTNKPDKTAGKTNTTNATEKAKIPDFLDCTINVNAKNVVYDDLNLENVLGNIIIKDETLRIQNLKTDVFEGKIGINGNVSTKTEKSIFNVDLDLKNLDIHQSFSQLKILEKIAPISNAITGKISSKIKVSGNLHDKELTPDLSSINGSLLGELHNAKVDRSKSKLLSNLDNNLDFINLDNLNLNKLKVDLSFENGKVNIKPMYINYQDIKIKISGYHNFDETMDYDATFNIPVKYLSKDIESLNVDKNEIDKIIISISAKITGNFSSPIIKTDINKALNDVYKQILNNKKNDIIGNILKNTKSNNIENSNKNSENNTVNEVKDLAKEALNSIFGRKK